MGKAKTFAFLIAVCVILLLIAAILFFILKPKVAGIYVESTPISTVFIDGEEVGMTPYRGTRSPG
jgi:hypothetical protein